MDVFLNGKNRRVRRKRRNSGPAFDKIFGTKKGVGTNTLEKPKPKKYPGAEEIMEEEAYILMKNPCRVALEKYHTIRKLHDIDDLRNSIMLHWMSSNYLKMYKPSITSKAYFICVGVRNWVVSYCNKARGPVRYVTTVKVIEKEKPKPKQIYKHDVLNKMFCSIDEETEKELEIFYAREKIVGKVHGFSELKTTSKSGEEYSSFEQTIPNRVDIDPLTKLILDEALDSLPTVARKEGIFKIPALSMEAEFNIKNVTFLHMNGFRDGDIAKIFEVSRQCVNNIVSEALELLRE